MTSIRLTEEVKLPTALMAAFTTNRPQLLKAAELPKKKFTEAEWQEWLNVFRVFMETLHQQQLENNSLRYLLRATHAACEVTKIDMRKVLEHVTATTKDLDKELNASVPAKDREDGKDVSQAVDSLPHLEG